MYVHILHIFHICMCICVYFVWGYFYKVYKGRSLLSALDLSVLETKQEEYQQSSVTHIFDAVTGYNGHF